MVVLLLVVVVVAADSCSVDPYLPVSDCSHRSAEMSGQAGRTA